MRVIFIQSQIHDKTKDICSGIDAEELLADYIFKSPVITIDQIHALFESSYQFKQLNMLLYHASWDQ